MCYNGSFYSVCDDYWDEQEAQVVCRQLGYNTSLGELEYTNRLKSKSAPNLGMVYLTFLG